MEVIAAANSSAKAFFALVNHPIKFRLFLLKKLPAAYFAGLRAEEINEENAIISVPFKWFTKNPFRSTYFACLSMAAEMSTGILALANIYKSKPRVSMLIVSMEGKFNKKAITKTKFVCKDGLLIKNAVQNSITTSQSQMVTATSIGYNNNNEVIAEFLFTWSFKAKS
ncbi:MAG TPA: hypothetical protein VNA26_03720 [Chitinophagaceae bacterium]|nr:hypothetical protein [Chitinophagaceae bacterium]